MNTNVPAPIFVLDPDGDNMAVCPVCGGEEVQWTPVAAGSRIGTAKSGHFYLLDDNTDANNQFATTTAKTHTLCLHMNGKNLTVSGRIAVVGNGGTINIMGNGTVTGTGTFAGTDAATYTKATIVVASGGTVNLYDDVTVTTTAVGKPVVNVQDLSRTNFNLYGNAKVVAMENGVGINVEKGIVSLNGASCADNIRIPEAGKLSVNGDWTGTAKVSFAAALVEGVVPEANGESTGNFSGTLTLDAEGAPTLIGEEGKLVVAQNVVATVLRVVKRAIRIA